MSFIPAVTKAIFPDTVKDSESTMKAYVYKDSIGRSSDFSIAAPFSFKTEFMGAFSTSSTDDRSYNNGYEKQYEYDESEIVDFVEDAHYFYHLELLKFFLVSTQYMVRIIKVSKSELFDSSYSSNIVTIVSPSVTANDIAANHNAHLVQDNDYVYVAINKPSTSQMVVAKVKKSDMSVEVSATEAWELPVIGNAADVWNIMDIGIDSDYVYICGNCEETGVSDEGWVAAYDKDTLAAVAVVQGYASTVYGYKFASLAVVADGLINVTGTDAGDTGITVLSFDGTAFTVESRCSITGTPDDEKHMDIGIDKTYRPETSMVSLNETTVKRFSNSGGAVGDGDGAYGIEIDPIENGSNFIVETMFNYGSVGADSQPIFRLKGVGVNFPLDIYITSGGVFTIKIYDGTALRTVATAPMPVPAPYETKYVRVVRRSGVVTITVDGVALTVTPTSYVGTPINYSDNNAILCGWDSQVDFCYKSIYFNINGAVVVNLDFSTGVTTSEDVVGLEYAKASYYDFESKTVSDVRRLSLHGGFITMARYSAFGYLYISRLDYDFTDLVSSSNLAGEFTTSGDKALFALRSPYDARYYILTSSNYDSKYCFQISKIYLLSNAGDYYFSFAPNARQVEVKFAPTATGYFVGDLYIVDVDSDYSQDFYCYGTCYEESETQTLNLKTAIIKMNEGHKDYLRYSTDDLTNKSIESFVRVDEYYKGQRYAYSSENATLTEDSDGLYGKETNTISQQDIANIYSAWFDTVNIYYDMSDGKVLKSNPLAVYIVAGATAMKANVQIALDSNYKMNTSKEPVRFSEDEDTGLIANSVVSARKELEVYAVRNLELRDHYAIRFRIECKTDGYYDQFRVYEMRYSPSGAFYVGGVDAEN